MATPPDFGDLSKKIRELNTEIKNLGGKGLPDLGKTISDMGGDVTKAEAVIDLLETKLDNLKNIFNNLSSYLKQTIDELKGGPNFVNKINKGYDKLESLARKLAAHKNNENILSAKQIELTKEEINNEIELLEKQQEGLTKKEKTVKLSEKESAYKKELEEALKVKNGYLRKFLTDSEKLLKTEADIQKRLGLTGKLYESIASSLKKIGIESDELDKIPKKLRKSAEEGKNSFKILGEAAKETGKLFWKSLNDPLTSFIVSAKLLQSAFNDAKKVITDIDTAAGDMAKSMGISYDSALKLNENLRTIAVNSKITGVNFKELSEAQKEFSSEFGTYNQIASENLIIQSQLTKLIGLQGEEGIKLFKTSALRGVEEKKFIEQVYGANKALNMRNKTFISEKAVMKEIATTSNVVKVSIKGGTEALVKSVQEAQKLGLSLNKIDGIAGSLLNFEQSITAELEAELITGQDLNLERARYYALTNDTNGLIQEINRQGITSVKFANMNRIAQEKTAAALGMSREEMADMFTEQESLNQLKKTAGYQDVKDLQAAEKKFKKRAEETSYAQALAELGESEFSDKMKTLSAQESMNDAMIKLGDIVKEMVDGPIGMFLSSITSIIQSLSKIGWLMKGIGIAMIGVFSAKALLGFYGMLRNITGAMKDIFKGKGKGGPFSFGKIQPQTGQLKMQFPTTGKEAVKAYEDAVAKGLKKVPFKNDVKLGMDSALKRYENPGTIKVSVYKDLTKRKISEISAKRQNQRRIPVKKQNQRKRVPQIENNDGFRNVTKKRRIPAKITPLSSKTIVSPKTIKKSSVSSTKTSSSIDKAVNEVTKASKSVTKISTSTTKAVNAATKASTSTINTANTVTKTSKSATKAVNEVTKATSKLVSSTDKITNKITKAVSSATKISTSTTKAVNAVTKASTSTTKAVNTSTKASTSTIKAINASTKASTSTTKAVNAATKASSSTTNAINAVTKITSSATKAASSATKASTSTIKAINTSTKASTSTTRAVNAVTKVASVTTKVTSSATKAASSATKAASSATKASTSTTRAINASTKASTSTTKAVNAATKVSTSTTKAINASTKASTSTTRAVNAVTKITSSATKAASSATKASISTTKAINASTKASISTTKAIDASTKAANASTKAANASTKAANATAKAANKISLSAKTRDSISKNRPSKLSNLPDFSEDEPKSKRSKRSKRSGKLGSLMTFLPDVISNLDPTGISDMLLDNLPDFSEDEPKSKKSRKSGKTKSKPSKITPKSTSRFGGNTLKSVSKFGGNALKSASKFGGAALKSAAGGVMGDVLAPATSVALTGKGLYDFFSDEKLRNTGVGGFFESLGGTGMGILDTLTFGTTKLLTNATGISIPGIDTDDVASARAIFHKSGRDPDNSRSPISLDNKQLIQDILMYPNNYPEEIVEQAQGVDIEELKLGGLVTQGGLAQVDTGEVYLGSNSLKVLKDMLDSLQKQNEYLKKQNENFALYVNKKQDIYFDTTKVGTSFSLNS